ASAATRRAATCCATATGATTATGARVRRKPRNAHALTETVVLLLTLCLQCERGQHRNALSFLETGDDLGIVEVRGAKHDNARMIGLMRAVGHENETGMSASA